MYTTEGGSHVWRGGQIKGRKGVGSSNRQGCGIGKNGETGAVTGATNGEGERTQNSSEG